MDDAGQVGFVELDTAGRSEFEKGHESNEELFKDRQVRDGVMMWAFGIELIGIESRLEPREPWRHR